jgi:hypothetical protein
MITEGGGDKALERKRKVKKVVYTAIVGAILAFVCRALPVEYQTPCETVIKICTTGGL